MISKNTRRQTKGLTWEFICRSSESPPRDPTSQLRKLELRTKSQLHAGSLLTAFLTPLALASFLAELKRTFTNFPTAHHNLGSSRAMPSHLGGFTSKSNKCHEDCFTKLKCSNHSQGGISQPKFGFLTNHSNLTKRCWGELTKALEMSIFISGTSSLQRREWKAFILTPEKLAIEN
jgi:hypothetical protein